MKKNCIGLVGWNGRKNAGDDAMSAAFLEAILSFRSGAEIKFYADDRSLPNVIKENARGLPLFNLISGLPGLRKRVLESFYVPVFIGKTGMDMLVLGGGSILKDLKTLEHYLNIVTSLKNKRPDSKIIAISVSLGPFKSDKEFSVCKQLLSYCNCVVVRDNRSLELASSMGLGCPVKKEFDAALAYASTQISSVRINGERKRSSVKTVVGICLRSGKDEEHQKKIVSWVSRLSSQDYHVVFISMSSNRRFDDSKFAESLSEKLNSISYDLVSYTGDLLKTFEALLGCDIVIAVRLHAMIFASAMNKKVLFYPYHQKLSDYASDLAASNINELPHDLTSFHPVDFFSPKPNANQNDLNRAIESSRRSLKIIKENLYES